MHALLYLLLIGACLSGCGQTGPLYMPQEEPATTVPAAPPSPTPAPSK